MIRDGDLILSNAQALTATAASTNVIDMTKAGDAVGAELYLVIRQGTLLDSSAEGATLTIDIQTSSAEAFGTYTVLARKVIVESTGLTAANKILWKIKLPPGVLQYLRVYYTVSGENFTSGTIDAFLTPDVDIA
jgi:bifunctional ADP-heptose synthase (sugar kinase/adenylyltransferase)